TRPWAGALHRVAAVWYQSRASRGPVVTASLDRLGAEQNDAGAAATLQGFGAGGVAGAPPRRGPCPIPIAPLIHREPGLPSAAPRRSSRRRSSASSRSRPPAASSSSS